MPNTVHCDIVSAEEKIYSGRVQALIAVGSLGELGIRPGHAPLLTDLQPGPVHITKADGEQEVIFVTGGYLEVQPNCITILADTAMRADDIDEVAAQKAKEAAQQAIAQQYTELEYATAAAELARAVGQLRVLKQAKSIRK